MDNRHLQIAQTCANNAGAGLGESYGIEIEVENYSPRSRPGDVATLSNNWELKNDGSLRNNGAEFVSRVLEPAAVENAVRHLYARTASKWQPSPRTGIHVHANMLGRTRDEVRRVCAYYAFVEPQMFRLAGEEREENIFCVPWYRAPMEAEVVRTALLAGDMVPFASFIQQSCKYSALYCGPLVTFGTIEFRHARTFHDPDSLLRWVDAVRAVANSYLLPDPVELYSTGGLAAIHAAVFGGEPSDWNEAELAEEARRTGSEEVGLLFQDYTYNQGEWGEPCRFVLDVPGPVIRTGRFLMDDEELLPSIEEEHDARELEDDEHEEEF